MIKAETTNNEKKAIEDRQNIIKDNRNITILLSIIIYVATVIAKDINIEVMIINVNIINGIRDREKKVRTKYLNDG